MRTRVGATTWQRFATSSSCSTVHDAFAARHHVPPALNATVGAVDELFATDDDAAIAAITVAELRGGVHLADDGCRAGREAFVDLALEVLPVVDYDTEVAVAHAELLAHERQSGTPRVPTTSSSSPRDWPPGAPSSPLTKRPSMRSRDRGALPSVTSDLASGGLRSEVETVDFDPESNRAAFLKLGMLPATIS